MIPPHSPGKTQREQARNAKPDRRSEPCRRRRTCWCERLCSHPGRGKKDSQAPPAPPPNPRQG
ncbi:hypothetical protein L083_0017 [Actinoplanes sp. N902-109]|nr:hypothetical protein L083_0017 [Actinoplanes sp. N902-109]